MAELKIEKGEGKMLLFLDVKAAETLVAGVDISRVYLGSYDREAGNFKLEDGRSLNALILKK